LASNVSYDNELVDKHPHSFIGSKYKHVLREKAIIRDTCKQSKNGQTPPINSSQLVVTTVYTSQRYQAVVGGRLSSPRRKQKWDGNYQTRLHYQHLTYKPCVHKKRATNDSTVVEQRGFAFCSALTRLYYQLLTDIPCVHKTPYHSKIWMLAKKMYHVYTKRRTTLKFECMRKKCTMCTQNAVPL
jgi:hypothetical protein